MTHGARRTTPGSPQDCKSGVLCNQTPRRQRYTAVAGRRFGHPRRGVDGGRSQRPAGGGVPRLGRRCATASSGILLRRRQILVRAAISTPLNSSSVAALPNAAHSFPPGTDPRISINAESAAG